MAASNAILGVSASTVSVNVENLAVTSLYRKAALPNGRGTEYGLNTATPGFPLMVRVTNALNPASKGIAARRVISLRILTNTERTSTLTDDVARAPITAAITLELPVDGTVDIADVDVLCANLYSLLYHQVTTGTRDTTRLGKLISGSIEL